MQFADPDVGRGDARLGHCGCGGVGAHAVPDEGDAAGVEEVGGVGREGLAGDEDGLAAEVGAREEEGFGDDDGGGGAVAGGAALEFGEGGVDGRAGFDFFQGVDVAELAVRVGGRVEMVDARDLGQVARFRAVELHVLPARIAKQLRRAGGIRDAPGLRHHRAGRAGWVLSVWEEGAQAAGEHLLEADDHDAVGGAVGNGLPRHVQAGGAGGAVVVDVVDGDARHAELVEDALAACGVAVAVAGNALVDGVVVELGVEEGFDAGLAMGE